MLPLLGWHLNTLSHRLDRPITATRFKVGIRCSQGILKDSFPLALLKFV
jgi:hypothetical protein